MGTFVFPGPEVQKLVDSARAAKSWRPTYGQKAAGPALWLVKDDGVYLMSNETIDRNVIGRHVSLPTKLPVVYADGYPAPHDSPDGFDAQWAKQQQAAGGDDFVELIEFNDWGDLTAFHVVEIELDEGTMVVSIGYLPS